MVDRLEISIVEMDETIRIILQMDVRRQFSRAFNDGNVICIALIKDAYCIGMHRFGKGCVDWHWCQKYAMRVVGLIWNSCTDNSSGMPLR